MSSFEGENEEWSVSVEDIERCSFGSWYDSFQSVTFKSKVIRLDHEHPFVKYLHSDGVFVHHDRVEYEVGEEFANEKAQMEVQAPSFPALEAEIQAAIDGFGGCVFPKLNWSTPKDAVWISSTGTVKCDSASEIFILLKSSDFVAHDLSHAFDACSVRTKTKPDGVELVLRKWFDLSPSLEFRCFVCQRVLVAISQRDSGSYYPFLLDVKSAVQKLVTDFYYSEIAPKFASADFVFDVYVSKNYDRVWLVDFNPSATTTEPLLFEWLEILDKPISPDALSLIKHRDPKGPVENALYQAVEFRIVESQAAIQTHTSQLNYVPKDLFDLSSSEGIDSFATAFRRGNLTKGEDDATTSAEEDEEEVAGK